MGHRVILPKIIKLIFVLVYVPISSNRPYSTGTNKTMEWDIEKLNTAKWRDKPCAMQGRYSYLQTGMLLHYFAAGYTEDIC